MKSSGIKLWLLAALMLLCGALFAPAAIAAEAHGEAAHGPATGEPGDHHADLKQHSPTDIMGSLMFWEYVTFGLVLVVLGVFVFPKLFGQLDRRQSSIKEALDKADQVRAEAEVLLKKHEDLMRRANDDAKKVTDEAVVAGRQARERIEQTAQQAAAEIKQRAEKEVELLTRKAEAELREQAVELALQAAGRVLERAVTGEDNRRLARDTIKAVSTMRN